MPKKRISSSKSSASRSVGSSYWMSLLLRSHQFHGISLGGAKTGKTCVSLIEYFPREKKIFLKELSSKIESNKNVNADENLLKILKQNPSRLTAINSPLKLPKCMRCRLVCPGYENCSEEEILWLWKKYRSESKKQKRKKLFTPYTERCAEFYISNFLEEKFHPPQALGANMAPLTARAHYLARHLPRTIFEFNSEVSLWRIGRSLGVAKSHLRSYKHAVVGREARRIVLKKLVEKDVVFLYYQDHKLLVEDKHAFESFIGSLTGVLKFQKQVEKKPRGFPQGGAWVEIPRVDIIW